MVKSTRDYIKRKLEQSRTHCIYIYEHLMYIHDKYAFGDYDDYLNAVERIIKQTAILDEMLKEFRKIV